MTSKRKALIEVKTVNKSFKKTDRQDLLVLDDINLKLYEKDST